ncbi:unnamed protein product [Parajaminaea phylloscopi]
MLRRRLAALLIVALLGCLLHTSPTLASTPYLCKCTCFSTNTTILPLYAPIDPSNPCTTCTRQFCIEQNLKECQGARIEKPDADTGTGWEGEVWARCFQRDSGKDQTIVTLYLFIVVGLLVAAALRSHLTLWIEEFRQGGPPALGRAVHSSWSSMLGSLPLPGRARRLNRRPMMG